MGKKTKGMIAAAAAFAATPQGQQFIRQLKGYATDPENRKKLQDLMDQAKEKAKAAKTRKSSGATG